MNRPMKPLNRLGLMLRTRRFGGTVAPAFAPIPLLHSVGGGPPWDEIIAFGLIIGFLIALGSFGYYIGRKRSKQRGSKQRRRSAGN